jgi:phage tail sheath protein FI
MPEYLAPGVYVEEVSFRSKSIEGVSTTTTGFIGPARSGPTDIEPELVTSLVEYDRVYGDQQKLEFSDGTTDNWLRHAVRAFFEEGGKRLYISRVYNAGGAEGAYPGHSAPLESPPSALPFSIVARFPGVAGDARVTIRLDLSRNRFAQTPSGNALRATLDRDVVHLSGAGTTATGFYLVRWDEPARSWVLLTAGHGESLIGGVSLTGLPRETVVRTVTATVTVEPAARTMPGYVAAELALDPRHTRSGTPDSLFAHFGPHARRRGSAEVGPAPSRARSVPILFTTPEGTDGVEILTALAGNYTIESPPSSPPDPGLLASLVGESDPARRSIAINLVGGSDGAAPKPSHYEGAVDPATDAKSGLKQFEDLEDISIVAAPGATAGDPGDAQATSATLIAHAERMRYRIAVIEAPRGATLSQARDFRARFDSSHAAFYYPWITIMDTLSGEPLDVSPAGFIAGIYARNDIERAVYKAPANEVINLAIGFERSINKAQQEVLNPEGINCLRYFEGRGYRVWGARTMSSDPEWVYVPIRRYFAYLERSIDVGTQWAVFEPNGERLWANIKRTIADFLLNEWVNGALLGDRPEKAYFVKCDRSTMTQNDLDNGRLIALVGVAALKPAEFVIFRIGQWTADRRI